MQNDSVRADLSSQYSLRRYLTEGIKFLIKSAAAKLTGSARRRFLAETVRELGWNRGTIGKEMHELTADIECMDAFCLRGRKRSEKHLPNLLDDIRRERFHPKSWSALGRVFNVEQMLDRRDQLFENFFSLLIFHHGRQDVFPSRFIPHEDRIGIPYRPGS